MMLSTSDEIRIMFYLIGYGVFCISSYDLVMLLKFKKTRNKNIILSIYSILILYISIEFSYKLANGYVPIHFILFMIIGFLIYITIRKSFLQGITYLYEIYLKIKKPIYKIICFLVYPKEIINIIKVCIKTVKRTIIDFKNKLIKKE